MPRNDILSHYHDCFFNLVHLFIARFSEAEVEAKRRARQKEKSEETLLQEYSDNVVKSCRNNP